MMMNLFSSFDPTTSSLISMNWFILFFILFIIPSNFFYYSNKLMKIINMLMLYLMSEFKTIMSNKLVNGSLNIIISLFMFIILSNSTGLLPWVFTSTSHLMVSLLMAFSMWMTFFMFSVFYNLKGFFSHLVPMGTPNMLMTFMVLIETVSLLIRPITLSVRLSANMIAGHLLLTLMGNSFMDSPILMYPLLYISQIMLMILELAVAMIQAYVFTMLMILYSMEI